MQQLWGAGPPWLWLISKDFGDVKIIRPFHGVKMTELSIILLWLWGWISTIMKVLFHKKSSCLFSWSFRNLYKNLCTLLQNYFWQMNNGANRRLKGQTDLKGAKNCILFRLLFVFLSWLDCGESWQWNFWLQIKWFPLGTLGFTLVVRTFWNVPIKVAHAFQMPVFSTSLSCEELGPLWKHIWFYFVF